ncbi:MAG TPA: type IV secretion system DNA-binding domain-containing protein [Fimbriimonas sp.]|nr:type IV secretion system DNA-binding domain-containing protein [Fimbriimonas sp.]
MRPIPGNDLDLGILPGGKARLKFPRTERDKHLYVCGGTGTGKSKFLEHLIRQDILSWRKSKCGVLVLDPHGSLYDGLMQWLAWHRIEAPIVPIDLRQDDWIVSYNLLRQRQLADPAVLVDNIIDAMAYVWGQGSTDQTPLFARWAGNILRTLYEKKLTLVESEHLIDRVSRQMRYLLTENMEDKSSRQDWQYANTLNPRDFESQIGSTINRLQRFIKNQTMRSMFGQPGVSLDLGKALEEGHIIIVSLATERAKVSKENAELFATLLMSDLWTAAQERGKRQGIKPFYVYLDEFQRFVTPTIAENLDEARGYGLHLTMAHQFPNQLLDRGDNGKRVYNSIMENASSKVVFRLSHEENLKVMAQWLFMGVMNPDEIKHELYSTKVMAYREEMRTSRTRSSSMGGGEFAGTTDSKSEGGSASNEDEAISWGTSGALSAGDSSTWTESESETESSVLIPIMGKELSHVQFRSLEEQLFRSMAVLFDQKQRQGVARLVGMSAPVSIRTPDVDQVPSSPERVREFADSRFKSLGFAIPGQEAKKLVAERMENIAERITKEIAQAAPQKRRIR